jgi:hypothetical protein
MGQDSMISRLLRRRQAATHGAKRSRAAAPSAENPEELLEEIDALTAENRGRRDLEVERRIVSLRHRAGLALAERPVLNPEYPAPDFDLLPAGPDLPEVTPGELTPELLRAAILRNGCLLVRGVIDRDQATHLAEEIDRAYEARDLKTSGGRSNSVYYEEFEPDPRFDIADERLWVSGGAGVWAADSPRVMVETLDALDRGGLRGLATEYLGERPAISVNKCLLRKVTPDIFKDTTASAWHQDGAFLGDVRALNIWLSLSRCGDLAPGLDIVPRRIDLVPTGTEGATFDWSVSQAVAEESAGELGISRPIFDPGDVLLFDELLLHSTAADEKMPNPRYAVESWFFGPSAFPDDYVPLAF